MIEELEVQPAKIIDYCPMQPANLMVVKVYTKRKFLN